VKSSVRIKPRRDHHPVGEMVALSSEAAGVAVVSDSSLLGFCSPVGMVDMC
jgi:hypothetical protein